MPHDTDSVQAALNSYMVSGEPSAVHKATGVPIRTIHHWMKQGLLTNGIPWKEYRQQMKAAELMNTRTAELEALRSGERSRKEQMMIDLWETVYERVVQKINLGDFDASPRDLTEILKLNEALENRSQEKIEFAKWFLSRVLAELLPIIDDRQYALFKAKMISLSQEVEARVNPLSKGMKQLTSAVGARS